MLATVINSSIKPKGRELVIPYLGDVDLVCKATGLPRPKIVMLFNDRDLRREQEDYTMTFEIRDATDKRDGVYCCEASNSLGSTSKWGECLTLDVQMPPDITSLKFDENVDDCFPEKESVTLKCVATGYPLPTVKLFDPENKEVKAGTEEASVSIDTSSSTDGMYACRATSPVGNDDRKELAFCVRVEIVFYVVTTHRNASDNDTCLPEGTSLTLCCTASAGDNSLETFQISTSEGSPIASNSGTKGKVCVGVKKSDNYSCRASTEYSSSQAHVSVCIDGQDDDKNVEALVGEAVGGAFFFLLIVIVVALIIFKRPSWKKDPEQSHLIEGFVPSSREQIEFVSAMLSRDWEVLRDFCRAIVPPFEKGESFIEAIEKARAKTDRTDAYWATRCLKTWIKENPRKDFIPAVYDALRRGIEDKKLARKLSERFPRPNLGDSLEMSPCASPLALEAV